MSENLPPGLPGGAVLCVLCEGAGCEGAQQLIAWIYFSC